MKRTGYYYKVQGDEIINGPRELPKSYGHISSFYKLPDEDLKLYGFLPEYRQEFDPKDYQSTSRKITVEEDKVTITYTLEERPTAVETQIAWDNLRVKRNKLLRECDFTQLPDAPVSEQLKVEYNTYRKALRDLPANTVDPFNPEWPTPPVHDES